jgi:predicted nucleic acid-binding protein
MIILDTNVLSELINPDGASQVFSWLDLQDRGGLHATAISVYELYFGARILAPGRKRLGLESALAMFLKDEIGGRILSFDEPAAMAAADLAARRRQAGRPVGEADLQIAAIALSRGLPIATRNIRHFEGSGVAVVNPWDAA